MYRRGVFEESEKVKYSERRTNLTYYVNFSDSKSSLIDLKGINN